jgi:flagellin-specific chaperone FliS
VALEIIRGLEVGLWLEKAYDLENHLGGVRLWIMNQETIMTMENSGVYLCTLHQFMRTLDQKLSVD